MQNKALKVKKTFDFCDFYPTMTDTNFTRNIIKLVALLLRVTPNLKLFCPCVSYQHTC
jgi:hypothetical protein